MVSDGKEFLHPAPLPSPGHLPSSLCIPTVSSYLPKARKAEQKLRGSATKGSARALRVHPRHVEKGVGHSRRATQTSCIATWKHALVRVPWGSRSWIWNCSEAHHGLRLLPYQWHLCCGKQDFSCDSEPVTYRVQFSLRFQYECRYWVGSNSRQEKSSSLGFVWLLDSTKTLHHDNAKIDTSHLLHFILCTKTPSHPSMSLPSVALTQLLSLSHVFNI